MSSPAESSPSSSAPGWPWPDALDAVVAAPKQHRVVLENERVRVLETRIEPGETTPLHTHRWPSVLQLVSWSDCVRRDENGAVVFDSRVAKFSPPAVWWGAALPPHTLENVGPTAIHILAVEIKDASA